MISIIVIFLNVMAVKAGNATKTNGESAYDTEIFYEDEFEYFYNLDLLEKFDLIVENETEIDENILLQLAQDDLEYEDSTELDIILDKLLNEGNLIEEVLDEFEDQLQRTTTDKDDQFMYLQNLILFYVFLISFVLMFIISTVFTGLNLLNKVNTKTRAKRSMKCVV